MTETKPQPARHLGHGAGEGRLVLHLHRKLPLFSYLPAECEHIFQGFLDTHTHLQRTKEQKSHIIHLPGGIKEKHSAIY